jgi:uncharacterized OsmC-like protein
MSETATGGYREVHASATAGAFGQRVAIGPHQLVADEPTANGGDDTGPAPHELLLASIACCASMTVKAYAAHKKLPLRHVEVTVRGRHDDNHVFVVERHVELVGDLDEAQRARLVEIAGRCPVARTLAAGVRLVSL